MDDYPPCTPSRQDATLDAFCPECGYPWLAHDRDNICRLPRKPAPPDVVEQSCKRCGVVRTITIPDPHEPPVAHLSRVRKPCADDRHEWTRAAMKTEKPSHR